MVILSTPIGHSPEPRLEQVLLPRKHEFEMAVPEGVTVYGYVLSYEIWNVFVRVNIALIDTPLGSIHDRPALRLADGSDARLVQGNGGGGERFAAGKSSRGTLRTRRAQSRAAARTVPDRLDSGSFGKRLGL